MQTNKPPQLNKLRPHETIQVLKILKVLSKKPTNTLAIYRELQSQHGFRNIHSFYRQLNFCIKHNLIELANITKKWGIPTKTYRLTKRGEKLLFLFGDSIRFYKTTSSLGC